MKQHLVNLFVCIVMITPNLHAQSVGVGTNTPHASAMLDISSSNKGVLIPRMDSATRKTIPSPAVGLLVYDNNTASFWYYANAQWNEIIPKALTNKITDLDGDTRIEVEANPDDDTIRMTSLGEPAFLMHQGSLVLKGKTGGALAEGNGIRLMWIASQGAFRAGYSLGDEWNSGDIGLYSAVVGGAGNKAIASNSFVGGGSNGSAIGAQSFVGGGFENNAFQNQSFVGGGNSDTATGTNSFIGGGFKNKAAGENSFVAGGESNKASGYRSFASGRGAIASGINAIVAGGWSGVASGSQAAVVGGYLDTASGAHAFTGGGRALHAASFGEAALGIYPTTYSPAAATSVHAADRIFTIGNGTDVDNRSNALTIFKNGNFVVDHDTVEGAGKRMMWIADKGAFRAGKPERPGVDSNRWNAANIGDYSFVAGGEGNQASGESSFASGRDANAVGEASFVAGGVSSSATGISAFVGGGSNNKASLMASFVGGGQSNRASGGNSFVGGGFGNNAFQSQSFVGGGNSDTATGINSFIGGGVENKAAGENSFVAGGESNKASGNRSFASGRGAIASGINAIVAGGWSGVASGSQAAVVGGYLDTASGAHAFTGGGRALHAASFGEAALGVYPTTYSPVAATSVHAADRIFTIGNGTDVDNRSNALTIFKNGNFVVDHDTVEGPGDRMMWIAEKAAFRAGSPTDFSNSNSTFWDIVNVGVLSAVVGGEASKASGRSSFIGGGKINRTSAVNAFVGGGENNLASSPGAFVGGGLAGTAQGFRSFVGAGQNNAAMFTNSFVGGGESDTASGIRSFIGGGKKGKTSATDAFVGGGENGLASATRAFVGGGFANIASGISSFAGGGDSLTASGENAFVAGGKKGTAAGNNSFIGGGRGLLAPSFSEAVFGTFNTIYSPMSTGGSDGADRLFTVGNGTAENNRSNALTILKNGNVAIGTDEFTGNYKLKVCGNIAATSATVTAITCTSDERYKKNILPLASSLALVQQLKGVAYQWNREAFPEKQFGTGSQIGFLAQDVESVLPELVTTGADGYKSVNYIEIIPILTEAIKEQQEEIGRLKTVLEKQSELEQKLERLEAQMNNIGKAE